MFPYIETTYSDDDGSEAAGTPPHIHSEELTGPLNNAAGDNDSFYASLPDRIEDGSDTEASGEAHVGGAH